MRLLEAEHAHFGPKPLAESIKDGPEIPKRINNTEVGDGFTEFEFAKCKSIIYLVRESWLSLLD